MIYTIFFVMILILSKSNKKVYFLSFMDIVMPIIMESICQKEKRVKLKKVQFL